MAAMAGEALGKRGLLSSLLLLLTAASVRAGGEPDFNLPTVLPGTPDTTGCVSTYTAAALKAQQCMERSFTVVQNLVRQEPLSPVLQSPPDHKVDRIGWDWSNVLHESVCDCSHGYQAATAACESDYQVGNQVKEATMSLKLACQATSWEAWAFKYLWLWLLLSLCCFCCCCYACCQCLCPRRRKRGRGLLLQDEDLEDGEDEDED
mmetsp:Transcript_84680/g.218265  ORF Transcript_84680/g.218265 Transcript_84680/m.218265 type:complete len:206 (-) Transcript_84680:87-704(-)